MDPVSVTSVSNNSPQSPTSGALLDNPITLDFDPMSFQFKEDSPLTSPSENSRELADALSPSQNLDVVDFFDPFCPVKEESPTDYPCVMIEQVAVGEPLADGSPSEMPDRGYSFSNYDTFQQVVTPDDDQTPEAVVSEEISPPAHVEIPCPPTSLPESPSQIETLPLEEPEPELELEPEPEIEVEEHVEMEEHVDVQPNIELSDLTDDNKHALEQDEVFQHGECDISENDLSKRGKVSSVSSVKSEKRSLRTSSSSSENSLREEKKNIKSIKIEEKVTQKVEPKIISASKLDKKLYEKQNGVDKSSNLKNGIDTNYVDDSHFKKNGHEENHTSVTELKSSFIKSDEETQQSHFQDEVKPSVDRAKVQRTFSQSTNDDAVLCKICSKHVYQMEKMKAEKNVFHKNCFRCKECNKLLNVDSYSSNEGDLYCKPHFKQLFQPKARFDGEDLAPRKQRRNEVIIRENVPAELPPDVVRSDSKPDHSLEILPVNLSNLKSKFEQYREEHHLPSTTDVCTLQRSASVMARLAKYQSAVSGENAENGDVSESESEGECEDPSVIKPTKHKEKVVFSGMSSLKSQWETGSVVVTKEERNEEKKEELNKLRQRMCLGRSESMKAVYEKACQDSTKGTPANRTETVDLGRDVKATRLKEKFEKGELVTEVDEEKLEKARREKEEDLSVFTEPVMATDAKKLFKQIDATVKTSTVSPISPSKSPTADRKIDHPRNISSQSSVNEAEIIKCSEPTEKEEIPIDTTDLSQRFKFFENYSESPMEKKRFQMTPPRDPPEEEDDTPAPVTAYDPNIVRAVDNYEEIPATDTARRMLDKFKALEKETPAVSAGPKPLKRITPPREYTKEANHDSSPEPERDPNIIRASYKSDEDIIVEADKAKSLRAKFENWDTERENQRNEDDIEDEDFLPQVDTTKTLRAKFEAIKEDTLKPLEKPKSKVNRFVQEMSGSISELCSICGKKVYPMEKMETSGMRLHKNCFRCAHCSCMLRLENYTTSGGKLYCTPHFKQLFISRGNYDEGFGREQHKEKWNRSCNNTPTPRDLQENCDVVDYTNGDVHCLEQTV